ncbi:response regulator [Paenibacillus aurantius]|uniref:Response regulator n=1 Tax=Paenibacillus aurantius TaxID=2918900 RepID=A0AA96LE73_9BACL|nr:response regulator [Paenibacillus aurantius]WNQ12414.1 response regulator [Paenibacillus aurantius]
MVRVLVVDDEKEIRGGLVTQLPWAEWGVDEVLDSDDGDTALELARRYRPDLIITDIRMPRMSGLQLLEELVKDRFEGGVIVISGYDDFHYAKEAFKLGVSDYLLKPISKDELEKAVAVSLERIREHVAQEQNRSLIQQGYELAIPRMREELLRNLIEKPYREDQVLRVHHKLKQLNLEWLLPGELRLIMFGVDSLRALTGAEGPEDKDALLGMLGEKLDLLFKEWQLDRYALFHSKEDAWVALVEDGEGMEGILDRLAKEACLRIGEELGIRLNWGAASTTGSLPRLHDLYRRALDSLVYLKVYGRTDADELEDDLQINLEVRLDNPKELVEILKYGTEHDIQETMEGFPRLVKSWNVQHPRDLQQKTFEWLLELFRTAHRSGWNDTSWEKNPILLWEHLERFDTLESLQKQATIRLLTTAASMKAQFDTRSQIVHEAKRVINQRYNENLTLQMVAEHVHVTPVWLSKLFKKETGMNFLEYLTDVRMTKAAELLADLNYKVYQISYRIGYQDPVYFSKLFKKKYGCTPQEYRNSKGNQHE